VSNVLTGASTAICVHLSNQAIFDKKIMNWKKEYDF
jgi:hypothetical protein